MKSRTPKILFATALALFLYIYFVERRGLDTEGQHARAARVLPGLRPDAVTGIQITISNQVLRLETGSEGWRIVSPSVYPAQTTLVEGLLDTLAGLSRVTYLTAADVAGLPKGLGGLGFEPAWATVVIMEGTSRSELLFGSRTVVGGNVYTRLLGQDGVMVVDASVLGRLTADHYTWRDRRLAGARAVGIDHFEVRRKNFPPMDLERDAATRRWRVTTPIQARADTTFVDGILEALQSSAAVRFLPDASAAELENFGLQPPELELGLKKGTNELVTLRFGKTLTNDLGLVYAQITEGRGVVAVDKNIADVLRAPIALYRDRHLLSIAVPGVKRMEVEATERFAVEKRGDAWWVLGKTTFRGDTEWIESALARVASLEIVDFLSDAVADYSPFGLVEPARRYRLLSGAAGGVGGGVATNQVLAEVLVGTNLVDRIVVRRGDESSVYAAKLGEVLRVPHSAYQLRDRKVAEFHVTNVTAVAIRSKSNALDITRSQNGTFTPPEGVQLAAVLEVIHRIGKLEAVSWVAQGKDAMARLGFDDSKYELRVDTLRNTEARSHWIRFGRKAPDGNTYAAALLDGEWVVFEFPAGLYRDVVTYLVVPEPVK